MKHFGVFFLIVFMIGCKSQAQSDTFRSKLKFYSNFKFRFEQDWDSRKTDGSYRADRFRMRYRARFGLNYRAADWASFGFRIRTGQRNKQQDPNITLGDGFGEFSTVPIGLDRLYFKMNYKALDGWIGKNSFPFTKLDELFWSDHVSPEGIFLRASYTWNTASVVQQADLRVGYFIVRTAGKGIENDSFLAAVQGNLKFLQNRLLFYPSFYYFKKLPDIPDGFDTYFLDYAIFQTGLKALLLNKPHIEFSAEYLRNMKDYNSHNEMASNLKDQVNGITLTAKWGNLHKKGDWSAQVFYTYLERFSAVDYFAQNDWARWDYSGYGSPDGRLTNMKGFQLTAAYKFAKKISMRVRYYNVSQIITYGAFSENGQRIRLDFNIAF